MTRQLFILTVAHIVVSCARWTATFALTIFLYISPAFGQNDTSDNIIILPSDSNLVVRQSIYNLHLTDTLTIGAQFSECGEWGGHREVFKIFYSDNKLITIFTKDTVPCQEGYLENKRKIIYKTSKELYNQNEKAIKDYLYKLYEKSLDTTYFGHAGYLYYTVSHKSNLSFYYYGYCWKEFIEMKTKILE